MKRNKGAKVVVIIAFLCIFIGAMMLGAGFVMGGDIHYLSINQKTASWWPFGNQSIGINFDSFDDDYEMKSYEAAFGDVHNIKIDSDVADIKIRRGDENKVFYKVKNKDYVTVSDSDDSLTIKVDHQVSLHNVQAEVIVQLKDTTYDNVTITTNVGDVEVNYLHAKAIHVQMDIGEIEMKNLMSEDLIVDQKCGDVDIEGVLLNMTTITNALGDTSIKVNGNEDEYRYEVSNTMGDTEIQDQDYEMNANVKAGNTAAKNVIVIDNKLGDIELEIY